MPLMLGGSHSRVSSPVPGISTLITSAPWSPSISVQYGPASARVRSSTRTPSSAPAAAGVTRGEYRWHDGGAASALSAHHRAVPRDAAAAAYLRAALPPAGAAQHGQRPSVRRRPDPLGSGGRRECRAARDWDGGEDHGLLAALRRPLVHRRPRSPPLRRGGDDPGLGAVPRRPRSLPRRSRRRGRGGGGRREPR